MSEDDITRIKVNEQSVGLVGLKQAMEQMAEQYAQRPDDKVRAELINRLSRTNYIPPSARDKYGKALLREFKKFLGEPFEENNAQGVEIRVLGAGCVQCNRLEKEVMEVVSEMNLATDVEHVTDIKEIGTYGVMGTPALIINGKVKSVGSVPPKAKIKEWLNEFA